METPDPLLPSAAVTIREVFDDETSGLLPSASMEEVRTFLEGKLTALLSTNPILLMSLLYQIDVPEKEVKAAFLQAPSGELAGELADLIIERQLQKVRIRRSFQQRP